MSDLVIKNGIIAATGTTADVFIEGTEITASGGSAAGELVLDASSLELYPGFIDVHCHGAVGVDINEADVDGLVKIAKFLASQGVTAWMPTLVPDSGENYGRVIGAIDSLMEIQGGLPVAQAVGVHYEGVFANEKMCGALRPEYFKHADPSALADLPRLKKGVHMTTFAPEVEGGVELAAELVRHGWIASIGHTRADVQTLDRAFDAGARHVTHFFNAMTGIHHRDVGVAGWALTKEGLTFDIIADGIHVHPSMLRLALRERSAEETILISDSVAPTGLGDGDFELWGEKVSVHAGRTRNERGSIAGSVISMLDAVRMTGSIGFGGEDIGRMAAANPAKLIGDTARGSIEPGKRADIVALDQNGDLKLTVIGGKVAVDAR